MSVSVTMPRLGESVTEGTVTRWLKKEGEQVAADEPLLEVSTDKVDTEIPAPASGVLSAIRVAEDETVEVGVELAVIDEAGAAGGSAAGPGGASPGGARPGSASPGSPCPGGASPGSPAQESQDQQAPEQEPTTDAPQQPAQPQQPAAADAAPAPAQQAPPAPTDGSAQQPAAEQPAAQPPADGQRAETQQPAQPSGREDEDSSGAYVTPLVRKLAAEHGVDLSAISGTGVGGRIRKQDVLEAARSRQPEPAAADRPRRGLSRPAAATASGCRRPRRTRPHPAPRARPRHSRSRPGSRRRRCAARPRRCPGCAASSPAGWSSRCRSARS